MIIDIIFILEKDRSEIERKYLFFILIVMMYIRLL
jgi:hypothetical protein